MDAPKYSLPVARYAFEQIENRRPLVDIGADAERGVRFKDNRSVLIRLESNFTEEEFMADTVGTVDAMLIDAAQSDYWYTFEKKYEDDYDETNDDSEQDDE